MRKLGHSRSSALDSGEQTDAGTFAVLWYKGARFREGADSSKWAQLDTTSTIGVHRGAIPAIVGVQPSNLKGRAGPVLRTYG